MSISSEQYYLGGLINEIDKDLNPNNFDKIISKEETTYKTSQEQFFSSKSSDIPKAIPNPFFSPALKTSSINQLNTLNSQKIKLVPKNNFLLIFNNQKTTKEYQKKLIGASNKYIENIVNELAGSFRLVIKNKNGNYFCSDLIKNCNKEQRIKILKELSNTMNLDCVDEFGTHVIQKLIECASGEEEYNLLLSSFNSPNSIFMSAKDQNGTYVIQKLIVHIPEKFRMNFNIIFINFVCPLSKDVYGVSTVKKYIGYTQNESLRKQFLNIIFNNIVNISSNQFGNYLIQYLLEKWWKSSEGIYLKKLIFSKFLILASNYYSSFICDLFYKLSSEDEKKSLATFIKSNNKIVDNLLKNNDIKNNRIPICLYKIKSLDNNNSNYYSKESSINKINIHKKEE